MSSAKLCVTGICACAVNIMAKTAFSLKWVRAADQKPVYNLEWPLLRSRSSVRDRAAWHALVLDLIQRVLVSSPVTEMLGRL